jgi:hypothetical protein
MTKYGDASTKQLRRMHTYSKKNYQLSMMLDKADMQYVEAMAKGKCITKGEVIRRMIKFYKENA